MLTVGDIYKTLDEFAPFASQVSWDNSGLLVGDKGMPAQRILTTLDISAQALACAAKEQVQLIVAHHPVIFTPLKSLPGTSPVYQLIAQGMAAICVHTPLDTAPKGLSHYAYEKLHQRLGLSGKPAVLEPTWTDGRGFGFVDTCAAPWTAEDMAQVLQQTFGCPALRYSRTQKPITKIAYCSGSAASMLEEAAALGCDALITGDIKHDRWYAAEYLGVALFDCGHYGTEQMAAELFQAVLQKAHPEADILCFPGDDPAKIWAGGAMG